MGNEKNMSYTMVIADDEPIVLKSQELFIQKEFPEIDIVGMAKNGIELKEMLEAYRPDLAIVDIRMPGLSGIEVMELLKDKELGTHFIINTAYSDFEYVKKALDLRTDGYILKPGKRQEKIDTIGRLLKTVKEEREENIKKQYLDAALDVVNPVFGSEILLSVFSEKCDEENFQAYLKINSIRFSAGCILTFLSKKDISRRKINQEMGSLLDGICDFLATVTKEGTVVMLFIPEELGEERQESWRDEVAELIARHIDEVTGGECLYGTGGIYRSFADMKLSYRESIEQLKSESSLETFPAPQEENEEKNKNYVQSAEQYIRSNFARDIALSDCAEYVGISPYYLSHIFKDKTGRTFIEYLTEVRINYARELCLDQNLSIKDISERCGYLNTTYFYKVFKKMVGSTIGEYRKKKQKKG